MAVGNIDLNQEIESWKSAVYGKDVRAANVAAFEKIQGTVNDTVQNVNQAAEDSASAAHNAQAAVDSIQAAVTTVTGKAAEAATSASQAADSQAAADSSKTAAAQSETNAAASAAEARQIAEGFGGFDGTAASVKATDTYGLVVDALGESTTQALIDAVANKVINELIAKSNIVNNLLATEVGTVLSGALGPIIDQRLTDLMNKYTQLNGEMVNGKLKGYIEVGNEDDIIEILQTLFNEYGFSYITISNPSKNVPSGFSYSSGFVVHRWDTLSVILLSYSISKIAINSCIKKNNAYTWTGWKIFTGNS